MDLWFTAINVAQTGFPAGIIRCSVHGVRGWTGESGRRGSLMPEWATMTREEQDKERQERLNESGSEPPCPFCGVPRVRRSDYIRCNQEGINWIDGEDLTKDPRLSRTRITALSPPASKDGAPIAGSISK